MVDPSGQKPRGGDCCKSSVITAFKYLLIIQITGPISIAAYMRQCLTSPDGGYYTSHEHDRDQFGQKGDFTTSPEVSQIFGELVGVWLVAEWMAQGKKSSGIGLIEVGPGRGTLMDDMLRVCLQKFYIAPRIGTDTICRLYKSSSRLPLVSTRSIL